MALSLVLFPLTAQAQSGREQVVQAVTNDLKPAFCANDLKQAMQIVEGCYAKVDQDSEKYNMNQCVLEDIMVIGAIKKKQKQYLTNYMPDPYAHLDFIQPVNVGLRVGKHPNSFTDAGSSEEMKKTFIEDVSTIIDNMKQENCFDLDKLK
ncbi:unnamed protein product [Commensalibacter communis]|nr:unnamed protein product [Commensalibacter communis]CAI3960083.1 unnamed protein product [Commensalibacter communis]